MNLNGTTTLCRLMSDMTRVRLLAVLAWEELSVAEITEVLRVPQSRVSTHLKKLREAGMVRDRRSGGSTFYVLNEGAMPAEAATVWALLAKSLRDPLLTEDRTRAVSLVAARNSGHTWADAVAGNMARHYSPGRTWEAAARAIAGVASLGNVLDVASGDGAIAELIAPRAHSITCVDISERIVAIGRERLAHVSNITFEHADMHDLPFRDGRFDVVMLMSALPYARDPQAVLAEAARVLRPGGTLVGAALRHHDHRATVARFNHANHGFEPKALHAQLESVGFVVDRCEVTSRERRLPHFEVITIHAHRRESPPR